jgi:uncharacterized protein (DUF302 family)
MNLRVRRHPPSGGWLRHGLPRVALVGATFLAAPSAPGADIYERTTQKAVAEVVADAEYAVTERNFRITGNLHIGKGIRERNGGEFPDYEVILFCNLAYAREMLELDPASINYCPGRVAVRSDAGGVVVSAPLLPQNTGDARVDALMTRLNTLIREIVDYAAEPWIREAR